MVDEIWPYVGNGGEDVVDVGVKVVGEGVGVKVVGEGVGVKVGGEGGGGVFGQSVCLARGRGGLIARVRWREGSFTAVVARSVSWKQPESGELE